MVLQWFSYGTITTLFHSSSPRSEFGGTFQTALGRPMISGKMYLGVSSVEYPTLRTTDCIGRVHWVNYPLASQHSY